MDNLIINFGKYDGLTFKQTLDKDINYCIWLNDKPANSKTNEFKHYLEKNLERAKFLDKEKKCKELNDRLSKF